MKVALYARYSSDNQRDASIADQLRVCRAYADRQSWTICEEYTDHAVSGATLLRAGFQALMRDALNRRFDVVLAESLDRFSRDQEDTAGLFKRLTFAGVNIVTLAEGDITHLHIGFKGNRGGRGGSEPRERERVEPRDVFVDRVSLPRGLEREHVRFREHDYTLRGSESRTLASVGAFRVVPAHDLRDSFDRPLDPRHGELWHLRDSGLVETVRLDRDTTAVTLTREGRDLLESRRRDGDWPERLTFNYGVQKPRELKHDAEVYRAYLEEAERLRDMDANIHRVVLENELKGEYQEFLQERNRNRDDSDGRPDRDPLEIHSWAREHNLPCDDQGHVQFPDVRIEYDIDGRDQTLDVEVMTPHYRGAHVAAKSGSGFTLYWSNRAGGGGRSGGRMPSIIEELLR